MKLKLIKEYDEFINEKSDLYGPDTADQAWNGFFLVRPGHYDLRSGMSFSYFFDDIEKRGDINFSKDLSAIIYSAFVNELNSAMRDNQRYIDAINVMLDRGYIHPTYRDHLQLVAACLTINLSRYKVKLDPNKLHIIFPNSANSGLDTVEYLNEMPKNVTSSGKFNYPYLSSTPDMLPVSFDLIDNRGMVEEMIDLMINVKSYAKEIRFAVIEDFSVLKNINKICKKYSFVVCNSYDLTSMPYDVGGRIIMPNLEDINGYVKAKRALSIKVDEVKMELINRSILEAGFKDVKDFTKSSKITLVPLPKKKLK